MSQSHQLFPRSRSFLYGLMLPVKAAKIILSHKALVILSLLPIVITALLYFVAIVKFQSAAHEWTSQLFVNWGLDPQGTIMMIARFFQWIILAVLSAVTFALTASVVAAPFNDALAEKTEPVSTPPLPTVGKQRISQMVKVIWIDLKKTIISGLIFVMSLALILIPVVNFFAAWIGILIVTFQFVTYPQSRRGIGLGESMRFLSHHLFASTGFGISISFLLGIPFISMIFLPLAVVGGTLLFARSQGGEFALK